MSSCRSRMNEARAPPPEAAGKLRRTDRVREQAGEVGRERGVRRWWQSEGESERAREGSKCGARGSEAG